MYVEMGSVTLRTGERVTAAVVHAPDLDWAARLEALLEHKGAPWTWENSELLRTESTLDARFFVLHRDGKPFANIMLVSRGGVALLGHVWTDAADRGTGASSLLMERVLADFRGHDGRAIFLGTVFDTLPWHYYRRRGFLPVEPGSGYMAWYRERETFEESWFNASTTTIEPLRWCHWPATAPLFLTADGGIARLVASPLFGRASSEDPLLPILRQLGVTRPSGPSAAAHVLRAAGSAAILGFASRMPDPLWPGTDIIDLFCHRTCWRRSPDLLGAIRIGAAPRMIAYCDPSQLEKRRALEHEGFREEARLPRWIKPAVAAAPPVDLSVLVHA